MTEAQKCCKFLAKASTVSSFRTAFAQLSVLTENLETVILQMTQSYLRNIILLKKRGENMFDLLFVNALRVSIFIIERNYLLELVQNSTSLNRFATKIASISKSYPSLT